MTKKHSARHDSEIQRHIYRLLGVGAVVLIAAGTVIFSALEEWSIVDSLYFSVVTVTTVGYGDLTPDTDAAKLFTVFYILVGISIIGTFLDARLKKHTRARTTHIEQDGELDG